MSLASSTPRSRHIDIDRLRLEVRESEGAGMPIFLFHGNSGAANSFDAILKGPLGRRRRMIAVSLPGHGGSGPAPDTASYRIRELGLVAARLVESWGESRYVLVGQSLGGHALLEALDAFPGAAGLVLISSPPISMETLARAFLPDPSNGCLFKASLDEAELRLLQSCFTNGLGAADEAAWRDNVRRTDVRFRPALGEGIAQGHVADECAALNSARMPVALLIGSDDRFLSQAYAASVAAPALWRGRAVFLEGRGHLLHQEDPRAFEDVLAQFLEDVAVTEQDGPGSAA
jgi:pimeloyl-ACP methyl ester carboxylesterase